ncbi:hypothetical protein J3R73_002451 [Labrys monachus]|uniref:Uncharacterized protein n=1 Tax=Labrys monachus TaxID=217067 RepID=A0ABU0FDJ2_9HYPH|nr:hypothetical protein [Labrys monachus]
MAWHVVQGRRRPFPAGPDAPTGNAPGLGSFPSIRIGPAAQTRTAGREASPAPEGTVPSITSPAGQATHPDTASGPGKPIGMRKPHPRNGGTGALADGLYLRRTPPAEQPGPRAAAAADAAGRVCRPPASDKAIRPGRPTLPSLRTIRRTAGASPVSRGIEGRPEGGPIPASSSSSPVYRPDGRVIAHPALPDVGGPGIAPEEDAMGRSAAIPLGAGPVLVSKPGRKWEGASMRMARRRRTGIGRSGWKARDGIANLGPAALHSRQK